VNPRIFDEFVPRVGVVDGCDLDLFYLDDVVCSGRSLGEDNDRPEVD
jgi:hypothetical protein